MILTDFHDSPRIDRQLFGRCARQGDPGSAVAIVAIDDVLVREHGGALHQALRRSYPQGPPPALFEQLRRHAQRRAEAIHARTRRDTLKQDLNLDTMLAFAGSQISSPPLPYSPRGLPPAPRRPRPRRNTSA